MQGHKLLEDLEKQMLEAERKSASNSQSKNYKKAWNALSDPFSESVGFGGTSGASASSSSSAPFFSSSSSTYNTGSDIHTNNLMKEEELFSDHEEMRKSSIVSKNFNFESAKKILQARF